MNKPLEVISPKSINCELLNIFLTKGKKYTIIDYNGYDSKHKHFFVIKGDKGDNMYCLEKDCGVLEGDWIISKRENDISNNEHDAIEQFNNNKKFKFNE